MGPVEHALRYNRHYSKPSAQSPNTSASSWIEWRWVVAGETPRLARDRAGSQLKILGSRLSERWIYSAPAASADSLALRRASWNCCASGVLPPGPGR